MVFFSRFYFVHFIVEWIGLRFFAIQINSSANLHRASNMSSYINQYYFLREFLLTYHDTNQLWNHYRLRTFLRSHFFFLKKIMNFIKSNSVKMKVATAEVQWNQSYKLHGKMYWGFLCVHNHFIFIGFAAFFPALLLLLFVIVFARLYHSNFFRSISSILWLYTKSKDKQMAKNIKYMNVCLV